MRIQVVILPNGEVGLYTQDGSFAAGAAAIQALLAALAAAGLPCTLVGDVEQHRHAAEPAPQAQPQRTEP